MRSKRACAARTGTGVAVRIGLLGFALFCSGAAVSSQPGDHAQHGADAVVLPHQDQPEFPAERMIQAMRDGKWGLLDQTGRVVLPFEYDWIGVDEAGDIILRKGKLHGKADASGRIFIPVTYAAIGSFRNGLVEVESVDHQWGVIDRNNNIVLPIRYGPLRYFGPGLYGVNVQDRDGIISVPGGAWVMVPELDLFGAPAKNGLMLATRDDGKKGFVDLSGKWVIAPGRFEDLWRFDDDGLAPASTGGKWGLIDRDGKWALRPISDAPLYGSFDGAGTLVVAIGEKFALVDRSGKFLLPPEYDMISAAQHGIRSVLRGGWGLVDARGRPIVPPIYDSVGDFYSKDIVMAVLGGRQFFLDRQGRRLFEAKFEYMDNFTGGGWAAAKQDGKWGAVNTRGEWIVQPIYECVHLCLQNGPPTVVRIQ